MVLCLLTAAGCATSRPAGPSSPQPTAETLTEQGAVPAGAIGPGDQLEVIVRRGAGEERSTPTVKEDGTASVSSVDIFVQGLTPAQAATQIEIALSRIIREPNVQVLLIKQKTVTTQQKVLVLGEVKKPGVYPLDPGLTVLQAIIGADGYNETAVLEDVRVIRGDLSKPVLLSINVERLLKQGDLTQNLRLQNNDIVYIPRQKIGDWNAFIAKVTPTLQVLIGLPINAVLGERPIINITPGSSP